MKAKHRKMLAELMQYANQLGGVLDGTSTNEAKYRDRQKANMLTYKVIYAILGDSPENPSSEYEFEIARKALDEMKALTEKEYPDRSGKH